jgi:beta-lactamase regulating signal transducer with metallopeptidase domain
VNPLVLLEIFISLSVQITLLIALTALIVKWSPFRACADTCWSMAHVCILLLTAAAFLLPHVRLVTVAEVQPSEGHPVLDMLAANIGQWCAWIWLTGTAVFAGVCALGMYRATMLVRRATVDSRFGRLMPSEPACAVAENIETRVLSDDVSPFCWQLHRPVIVMPDLVWDFPAAEQAAILRHECAHIEAQHPLHLFLQRMVEALYWYHPLVWWASRQAAAAREFRCDRDSVRSKTEVAHYLRSLLRLIERKVHPPGRLPAGIGFVGNASLLSQRAHKLGEFCEASTHSASVRRAAAVVAMGAVLCSLAWLPVNPDASRRSIWSPWPGWSARALNLVGVVVRDYEVDGHRLSLHNHDK